MKSRLTALLLTLALLLTALPVCAAAEETSSTRMPLYDVFPLQLDDNTVLELPVDWGYQFVELEGVPPIAYAMNDSEQLLMMVKIPADYTPNEASDRLGLTSFIPEGTAVMLGITTPQSTRLQEMTINDMPAVLVELGYCTNPAEARNLADPKYRHALAEGLAEGILAYKDRLLKRQTAQNSLTPNGPGAM